MPAAFRVTLRETSRSGQQADGTHLRFYGEVVAEERIGKLQMKDKFILGQICNDVILGMPFLVSQGCVIHFHSTKWIDSANS